MSSLKILAVGAHPDDIEFGCGGVLLKEAKRGCEISLLVCSKGESGSNGSPEERVAECEKAAQSLGATVSFIECGGDGLIDANRKNALLIARAIRTVRPNVVLAPSLLRNQHPDHVAIAESVLDGARLARYGGLDALSEISPHAIESLFWYAITPGSEPQSCGKVVFNISDVIEDWKTLMACHETQMKTRRYLELQISRARVLGLESGNEYAQALWPNDPISCESLSSVRHGVRSF